MRQKHNVAVSSGNFGDVLEVFLERKNGKNSASAGCLALSCELGASRRPGIDIQPVFKEALGLSRHPEANCTRIPSGNTPNNHFGQEIGNQGRNLGPTGLGTWISSR